MMHSAALRFYRKICHLDNLIRVGVDRVLPKNLTIRYSAALIAVATLAVSGQIVIQTSLSRQTGDQERIRLLERQIHDSENLRKAVMSLQLSSNESQIKIQIELIESLVSQFQRNGEILKVYGLSSESGFWIPSELTSNLKKIEASLAGVIENCRILSTDMVSIPEQKLSSVTRELLGHETLYRSGLVETSKYYEKQLEEELIAFKRIELLLLCFTLFVLITEALYVFRPAVESLYAALRVRSDFLGRMGHELRNPMNSILGMTHLLLETPLTDTQRKYLSILKKSSTGLLDVLNNLLDFSSLESGNIKVEKISFDFKKLLEESIDLGVYGAHSNGIELILNLEPNVPLKLIGDPVRLKQILTNLLGNAIKFTKKGKVILKVQLQRKSEEEVWIQFEVIDTGMGIDKDKVDKIFDAFVQEDSTVRRRFGGTGLGLSISKDLVSLLGGILAVESQKNLGSRFYFTLPLTLLSTLDSDASVEDIALEDKELVHDNRTLQILAVDDSKDNQFLVKAYLSSLPYRITFADNGREAVDRVKNSRFDLILMDLQMPEMDGYTATQLIREWELAKGDSEIPIVAVSAHESEEGSDRFRNSQFTSYLVKPVSPYRLRQTILSFTSPLEIPYSKSNIELENELASLAPQYLKNRTQELGELKELLIQSDFSKIQTLGHRLKGNAKSYGFEQLGEIGSQLEEAAQVQDSSRIKVLIHETESYLSQFLIS